jgi:transposase
MNKSPEQLAYERGFRDGVQATKAVVAKTKVEPLPVSLDRYTGYLQPFATEIVERFQSGESPTATANAIRDRVPGVSPEMVYYVLTRVGAR